MRVKIKLKKIMKTKKVDEKRDSPMSVKSEDIVRVDEKPIKVV